MGKTTETVEEQDRQINLKDAIGLIREEIRTVDRISSGIYEYFTGKTDEKKAKGDNSTPMEDLMELKDDLGIIGKKLEEVNAHIGLLPVSVGEPDKP